MIYMSQPFAPLGPLWDCFASHLRDLLPPSERVHLFRAFGQDLAPAGHMFFRVEGKNFSNSGSNSIRIKIVEFDWPLVFDLPARSDADLANFRKGSILRLDYETAAVKGHRFVRFKISDELAEKLGHASGFEIEREVFA